MPPTYGKCEWRLTIEIEECVGTQMTVSRTTEKKVKSEVEVKTLT